MTLNDWNTVAAAARLHVPRWIVVVEGVSLDAVNAACDEHLCALERYGCAGPVERDTYQLQIMVTR